MELIRIRQNGTKVEFTFNPKMNDGKVMVLSWERREEWYAELLTKRCLDQSSEVMRKIRAEEYKAGWKDAKSKKRPKRDWFSGYCGTR